MTWIWLPKPLRRQMLIVLTILQVKNVAEVKTSALAYLPSNSTCLRT